MVQTHLMLVAAQNFSLLENAHSLMADDRDGRQEIAERIAFGTGGSA
jgi:hypothetical protein